MTLKLVLGVLVLCRCAPATKVGVLASHNPARCGSDGSQATVECNLQIYEAAIASVRSEANAVPTFHPSSISSRYSEPSIYSTVHTRCCTFYAQNVPSVSG